MTEWWAQLNNLTRFFYLFAIPSTIVLFIQSILTLIGFGLGDNDLDFGDGDTDIDIDLDGDIDFDSNVVDELENFSAGADFRLVTFRGIIAFATMFGWMGAALSTSDLHITLTMLLAIIAGLFGMLIVALLFYGISKLQQSGNINYRNAIGSEASVYIPIPANKEGKGKVQLLLQDSYLEVDAVTEDATMIRTNELVRIVDMLNATTLVVERLQ